MKKLCCALILFFGLSVAWAQNSPDEPDSVAVRPQNGSVQFETDGFTVKNLDKITFYTPSYTKGTFRFYDAASLDIVNGGHIFGFGTNSIGQFELIANGFNGFGTGNTKLVVDDSTGNVGIGTLTPDYKLDVHGVIRAEELIVETGWADYVFDEQYKLPHLDEVEQFIRTHKHLPDIPSATEINRQGAHMAELLTKMMAKIEELTLYTINNQKAIEALKIKLEKK